MAQYRVDTSRYLNNCNTIFEVVQVATRDGGPVTNTNPLPVSIQSSNTIAFVSASDLPWKFQLDAGNVSGYTEVNVQGFNSSQPNSWRAAWELSNSVDYVFPASAVAMAFTSSSSETLTMTVQGLDASYNIKTATVTFTAGTTGVVTSGTSTFFRINKMIITSGTSVGNISATNNGTTYS